MNKVVIFDHIDVEAAVNNMAFQLNVMLKGQTAVLVPVMIGGLYRAEQDDELVTAKRLSCNYGNMQRIANELNELL